MKDQTAGILDSAIIDSLGLLLSSLMESELSKVSYILHPPDEGYEYHWFFNINTKTLERFNKDIHVEIIEDYNDDSYLCFYKNTSILIKKSKISSKVEH